MTDKRGINLRASLDDQASGKLGGLQDKLGGVADKSGNAASSFGKLGGGMQGASKMGAALQGVIVGVASKLTEMAMGALARATAAVTNFIKSGRELGNELDMAHIRFTRMMGSSSAAGQAVKDASDLAANSPWGIKEIVDARAQLEGLGLTGKDTMKLIGDTAAATGSSMTQIADMMGALVAGQGSRALMMIQKQGIATREQMEMHGLRFDPDGKFLGTANEALTGFQDLFRNKFGGTLDEIGNTWDGATGTMKDTWQILAREITKPVFDYLIVKVKAAIEWINAFRESATAKKISEGLVLGAWYAENAVRTLIHVIQNIRAYTAATLNAAVNYWDAFFGAVVSGVKMFTGNWNETWEIIRLGAVGVFKTLANLVLGTWDRIKLFGELVTNLFSNLGDVIAAAFSGRLREIPGILSATWDAVKADGSAIAEHFEGVVADEMLEAGVRAGAMFQEGFAATFQEGIDRAKREWNRDMGEIGGPTLAARPVIGGDAGGAEDMVRPIVEANQTAAAKVAMAWTEAMNVTADILEGGFQALGRKVVDGHAQLADFTRAIWAGVTDFAIKAVARMASTWIVEQAAMLFATKASEAAKTAAVATGTGARVALQATETVSTNVQAGADKQGAIAKIFNAHAWIPFVGVAIAMGLIATMMGAFSKHRSGFIPGPGSGSEDDRLALLSPGEAVIPAHRTSQYRAELEAMMAGTFQRASGDDISVNFYLSGGGGDIQQQIEAEVVPILRRLQRQGRLRLGRGRAS